LPAQREVPPVAAIRTGDGRTSTDAVVRSATPSPLRKHALLPFKVRKT